MNIITVITNTTFRTLVMRIIFFNIGTILFLTSTTSSFTPGIIGTSNFKMSSPSSSSRNDNTKLRMNLDGGLEIAEEYATPLCEFF